MKGELAKRSLVLDQTYCEMPVKQHVYYIESRVVKLISEEKVRKIKRSPGRKKLSGIALWVGKGCRTTYENLWESPKGKRGLSLVAGSTSEGSSSRGTPGVERGYRMVRNGVQPIKKEHMSEARGRRLATERAISAEGRRI